MTAADGSGLTMASEEDFDLQTLESKLMSMPMNREDERCIQGIKRDLINSLAEDIISSNCTLNDLTKNYADEFNSIEEQRLLSDSSTNLTFQMDIDGVCKELEQISSYTNATTYGEQDSDNATQHDEISQPLTTDNPSTNEQQMHALEYCQQLLEKLRLAVNTLEPTLTCLTISARTADYYLKNLQIPSSDQLNPTAQDPLEKVTNLFQIGVDLLSSFRPVHNGTNIKHTDPIGEELKESLEKAVSGPSEDDGHHLNEDIQAFLPEPILSKDGDIAGLSLSLSQAKMVIKELNLVKLEIEEQPQLFWKKRSINCLREKWCPCIQGRSGIQRHYIQIKWSKLPEGSRKATFVLVQLLSYDNQPHPSNVLVPFGTKVRQPEKRKSQVKVRPTLGDLIIKKEYGFDKKKNRVLCPISEADYRQCKKKIQVIMFSLYKTSEEIVELDHCQDIEENEADGSIDDELRKLCRLRICLYQLTERGDLMNTSNSIDTELIEESKGSEQLTVVESKISPKYLCACGNETITITLNTDSEKNGFVVRLNGTLLHFGQIRGVTKKQIFFNSLPMEESGQNYLNIKISKKSISTTIRDNHDPYDGLDENQLLDMDIPYVSHSDNGHVHKDSI